MVKIIHLMDHSPPYNEFANKPRPPISWDTSNNGWVGIWGYDWSDQIASNIQNVTGKFECEVWQPDIRADKVYSYNFKGGWRHLQFPAKEVSYWYGIKKQIYLASDSLIELLEKNLTYNTILHLPFPSSPLIQTVIRKFSNTRIVCSCLGDLPLPSLRLLKLNKNLLSKINLIQQYFIIKDLINHVNAFTIINHNHLDSFSKVFSGPYSIVPMGIDTSVWSKKDKTESRETLHLPLDKTILFSSSRLNSLKQIDKLIQILNKLSSNHDFLFILSGHGTRSYEEYLIKESQPMIEKKKMIFIGYVTDAELIDYYNAADVFILTSLSEGSPVGVQKAFACGVPVLSTNVGYTAELMLKHNVGIVMQKTAYAQWEENLENILSGNFPRPFEPKLAIKYFSWQNVAQQFIDVFNSV